MPVVEQVAETVAICRWCGKENPVPADGGLPKCDCLGSGAIASVHTLTAAAPAEAQKESARRANLALEDMLGVARRGVSTNRAGDRIAGEQV
jgi:hypothetical protein